MLARRTLPILVIAFAAPASGSTITVSPGDTLSALAEQELGRVDSWREICDLNADILNGNCNLLPVGATLVLPDQGKASEQPQGNTTFGLEGDYVAAGDELPTLRTPEGYTVVPGTDGLRLSGYSDMPRSAGRTGGIFFNVPDEIEQAASGKTVRIHIQAVGIENVSGEFAAAYSTFEVGNSGWQTLALGEDEASFEFSVPLMQEGGGDYIGILPDPSGLGQTIELLGIAVEVLD